MGIRTLNYTDTRTYPQQKHVRIKDFFRHLPHDISRTDHKALVQFVVNRFGQMRDLHFILHKQYTVSKRARGRTSDYNGSQVYHHKCSQMARPQRPSTLAYGKTRNRRPRMQVMDCDGTLTVTVFPVSDDREFDIAVDLVHLHDHQGREHYGVPQSVRRWIQENPRHSPGDERRDLLAAIERGELNVEKEYLSPNNIFYWWRKMYKEKQYTSKDPWENAWNILQNHAGVTLSHVALILGNQGHLQY